MCRHWLIGLMALVLLAGCKGGSGVASESLDAGQLVNNESLARLPDAEEGTAVVRGTLTLIDLTIITQSVASQVGDLSQVQVRLVDPEDDILAETSPDQVGFYELAVPVGPTNAKVNFEFLVEEDLNGDAQGGDILAQTLPITLAPNKVVRLDLTLSIALEESYDQILGQATGAVIQARYSALDAYGLHEDLYALFYGTAQVVYDRDGDEFFERGEDLALVDNDLNGWADQYELIFPATNALEPLEGTIVAVNLGQQTLTIRTTADILVQLQPFASIEVFSERQGFIGFVPLDPSLVGSDAVIWGTPTATGLDATRVVITQS